MIQITEQELKAILERLSDIPLKYSVELFGFFTDKANKAKVIEPENKNDRNKKEK